MPLTTADKSWLEAYGKAAEETHPGAVARLTVFGSKVRGDDRPDSDLDVLLIVQDRAAHLKRKLRGLGYLLAATGETVPSIMVYTESEWEGRKRSGSAFRRNVERDQERIP